MSQQSLQYTETIHLAAELLKKSRLTVVTDRCRYLNAFRDPRFSAAQVVDRGPAIEPMEVASLSAFRHNPEQFYTLVPSPGSPGAVSNSPTLPIQALAKLQAGGYISTIITQNIDGLLSRAGANVTGSARQLEYIDLHQLLPADPHLPRSSMSILIIATIPLCPTCGSVLKPNIILYEEQLPVSTWNKAEVACQNCELMLVAGTSLEVMPSARLPVQAMDHGAKLIIINNAATFMDVRANVVIHADVAEILPQIMNEVLGA